MDVGWWYDDEDGNRNGMGMGRVVSEGMVDGCCGGSSSGDKQG